MSSPTTTITWVIESMEGDSSDGFSDTAHWAVNAVSSATDSEGNRIKGRVYGQVGLERPEELVPFDDLRQADVISAVKAALGTEMVEKIENGLTAGIAKKVAAMRFRSLPSNW